MEARTNLAGSPPEDVRAHMDHTWKGTVTIVQAETMVHPSTERYAIVCVCFHGRVAVSWCSGDEHTFDARTGLCIESSDGRMKGWRIAPYEMHRFNAVDAAKWLEAEKAGGMSVGNAVVENPLPRGARIFRDGKDVTGINALAVADDVESQAKHPHDQQDVQPVRSVLFIATCYPGGLFAIDATGVVYKAMHAIALERGIITKHDQCEYVTMEGALVGERFDTVISTDDWLMNILPREGAEAKWWKSQVLPRHRFGCATHFLHTFEVRRRPVPQDA